MKQRNGVFLAHGTSQHQFITRRMEDLHSRLHNLLGDEAIALVVAQLDQTTHVNKECIEGGKQQAQPHFC